jgi:hypothetical protein
MSVRLPPPPSLRGVQYPVAVPEAIAAADDEEPPKIPPRPAYQPKEKDRVDTGVTTTEESVADGGPAPGKPDAMPEPEQNDRYV